MGFWEAVLLSLIQGATEFLPVSSSGHLVLGEALFGGAAQGDTVGFVILAHVGTLLAVLFVFRGRLMELGRYVLGGWRGVGREHGLRGVLLSDPRGRLLCFVFLSFFVTGVLGFVGKDFFEGLFAHPRLVGFALCGTAGLLFLGGRLSAGREVTGRPDGGLTFWKAGLLGVVQALAIIPGISRSGATISAGLVFGLDREKAGEFSFLIFIPTILAVLAHEWMNAGEREGTLSFWVGLTTLVVSGVSGYIFLRILLGFVRGGRLGIFGWYCLVVGIAAIWYF